MILPLVILEAGILKAVVIISSLLNVVMSLKCYFFLFIFLNKFVTGPMPNVSKSSTLPLPHRLSVERPASSMASGRDRDRERDGYYSDRNELVREREKERERERGYLSDHNSR